jgi:hypothetical protein
MDRHIIASRGQMANRQISKSANRQISKSANRELRITNYELRITNYERGLAKRGKVVYNIANDNHLQ